MLSTILPFIPFVVIAIVVIAILCSGYIKAPPDMAYIISGLHKKPRILIGKAGIKIPFFERVDKLSLGAIQIDVKTGSAVPTAEYINVRVDSTVSVRVGRTDEMIALAAQNFLNVGREEIARKINDLLEGNIREIVGQMKLTEMIGDRKSFSEKVQENAVPDLARYGLELITFNVQNFVDDNDVIQNLGIDNVAQISKNAAIARSNAEREVEVAKAANAKQANDAKVQAAEEIAKRNNDLAIKQANLQREADTEKARAEAAKSIEAENQRKLKDVAETEANIAKAQKQAELKQKEIDDLKKQREMLLVNEILPELKSYEAPYVSIPNGPSDEIQIKFRKKPTFTIDEERLKKERPDIYKTYVENVEKFNTTLFKKEQPDVAKLYRKVQHVTDAYMNYCEVKFAQKK